MAQITATMVKELREKTNAGMMDCKKALTEAGGDMEQANKLLRERGLVIAAKKASREAAEGLIAIEVSDDFKQAGMIEVNCETDFVAKNDNFQAFVKELAEASLKHEDGTLADAVKDTVAAKIAEIGENIVVKQHIRYTVEGSGGIASYIHLGGKVGVLMELGVENQDSVNQAAFQQLGKDLCMHVAALNPQALSRDDLDAEVVAAEKAIYAKQMEGKPAEIIEKILTGKMEKFYSQVTFLEQGFVKEPDTSIKDLIAQTGKQLGDTITVKRYVRIQIGG